MDSLSPLVPTACRLWCRDRFGGIDRRRLHAPLDAYATLDDSHRLCHGTGIRLGAWSPALKTTNVPSQGRLANRKVLSRSRYRVDAVYRHLRRLSHSNRSWLLSRLYLHDGRNRIRGRRRDVLSFSMPGAFRASVQISDRPISWRSRINRIEYSPTNVVDRGTFTFPELSLPIDERL